MRLTLSALLCAAALTSPALAGDKHRHRDDGPPPWGADMPPPPPGYGAPYAPYDGPPMDPRWHDDRARAHGEWMERCGKHAHDDRDGPGRPPHGCGYPAPYGYGHPGAYMTYGVPVIMVPVMRSKPCKEVVEVVEEVVPVRRRVIAPRPRPVYRAVPDKRVRIVPDKRVPVAPSKRIEY